ncbi:hypothetical protein [Facilibium subflavum]|uniref:hypothetical protein n=1 Tax=Facilibium subflavum TaxID=2219058 RepID=UPI000E64C447|nr:hypothetical protein [Facilibium subflavum]
MESIHKLDYTLTKCWDLRNHDISQYKNLLSINPEIEKTLKDIENDFIVANTCRSFSEKNFFRLEGHARSFCIRVAEGVLVIKGTEPFSEDYSWLYKKEITYPMGVVPSKIDGFPMFGHEIYLALTLQAAINCASKSYNFTNNYYTNIGHFPKVALPISVYKIPESISRKFISNISPFLSNRSQFSVLDYTKKLASDGLAIYIYYYHGNPLRAAHAINKYPLAIADVGDVLWKKQNYDLSKKSFKKSLYSWVELVVNMIGLGYVPTTWLHSGNCMQLQNLVLDGGLHSIESIELINNLKSNADLLRAIMISIMTLSKSFSDLYNYDVEPVFTSVTDQLLGKNQQNPYRAIDLHIALTAICSEISKQIKLNQHGLNYDKRITILFDKSGIEMLNHMQSMLA